MPVIDFHTHAFPDDLAPRAIETLTSETPDMKNATDGTVGGLVRSMDEAGIERSVVLPVATKAEQVPTINQAAGALRSNRIEPFGALYPYDPHLDERIAQIRAIGLRGIKLHPEYQNFYVDDPRFDPMYSMLQDSGLIVVFHAGKDPGPFSSDHALPHALAAVAQKFPRLLMVASHMGGFRCWDEVERELLGTSLFLDTSAVYQEIGTERFERIVNYHGAERILFGTDSPWFSQEETLNWFERLRLGSEQKEKILFQNARMLLGGVPPEDFPEAYFQ